MIQRIRNAVLADADPTARPRVSEQVRIYAIGDIHGRHDLMIAMLEAIIQDAEARQDDRRCEIVFLGDYIDRGDHPRSVVQTLMEIAGDEAPGVIALRGNHEDALLDFLKSPLQATAWLDFGARQTIADYGISQPSRTPSEDELVELRDALEVAMGEHVSFLRSLPSHYLSGDVIFAHAGIAPGDAQTLSNQRAMIWGHPASESDWPAHGKLLVHGHYDTLAPVDRPGRICVDTGAYYTGQLTAARLDSDSSFLSVQR
jgi:serine/threonine protein phosphatase 1